jgi:hypothetical protein
MPMAMTDAARCRFATQNSRQLKSPLLLPYGTSRGFWCCLQTCDAKQCVERRKKKQRIDAPTVTHKVPFPALPSDLIYCRHDF